MPKVLAISRHFPPLSSAGASIRLVKMIKYLSMHGWMFIVLTQHPDHPVVSEDVLSSFLEEEIPSNTVVVREQTSKFTSRLFPGASLLWGFRVIRHGLQYIKAADIDLIYAVAPVFTNALVGSTLRWLTGKQFLLDLKDDWVDSPTFNHKPFWRRVIEKKLERLIVNSASGIVLVTEQSYKLYTERYKGKHHSEKFHLIPNGCDLDEYTPLRKRKPVIDKNKFRIVSAAWGYQKDYRDIEPFLRAFNNFVKLIPTAVDQVELILLGDSLSDEYIPVIEELGIQSVIHQIGAVTREELVEWLWLADLFFLVQPVGNTTAISGTIYEYWATGKAPILLISEIGASSQLIEQHDLGWSFRFHEVDQIAQCLLKVYQANKIGEPIRITYDGIENYDRKNLAVRMADIFNNTIHKTTQGFR